MNVHRFVALVLAAVGLWSWTLEGAALAQTARGEISGTVASAAGTPLASVTIALSGPQMAQTTSDDRGMFSFAGLAPGLYTIVASKAGFASATQTDVTVNTDQAARVTFTLAAASFSSLNVIGQVSTTSRLPLNTSAVSVNVINADTISREGTHQVFSALEETPGVLITAGNAAGNQNGASPGFTGLVQIRGALPYETQTLVDGHPVSIGYGSGGTASAGYTPAYLNPWLLNDIQIVKGPGYLGPDINYAITGTVNYRTLQPTREARFSFDIDTDMLGGVNTNYRATGTTFNGHLGYALDYALFGTPGPYNAPQYQSGYYSLGTINGQPLISYNGLGTLLPQDPRFLGNDFGASSTLALCCFSYANSTYSSRAELAKLVYNFSDQTSLSASWLGDQVLSNSYFESGFVTWRVPFQPGPGYAGALTPGTQMPFLNAQFGGWDARQDGLVQGEFRTTLGPATFLARYYAGASRVFQTYGCFTFSSCSQPVTLNVTLFGTIANPDGTNTVYNGTPAVLGYGYGLSTLEQDHFRGYSAEFDIPAGDNTYSISWDRSQHTDSVVNADFLDAANFSGIPIPEGSGETFQTFLAKGSWKLGPVNASLGYYLIGYKEHYTPDGGATWLDSSHTFNAPRAAFSYRPDSNTSWRFALGSSIAPPTIGLITTPAQAPQPNTTPVNFYTQILPSGDVAPETAFNYDLGVDKRLPGLGLLISGDVYFTTLRNQYLQTTSSAGTYTPPAGTGVASGVTAPLFLVQTQNLGHARYEGIELSIHRNVGRGVGFKLQGDLLRAYTYDLPASFYATGTGPFTANLAVIPNVNYYPSGIGFNGAGYGRVPYATGYGELNFSSRRFYAQLGTQYYGNNNSYNQPAFAVVNGSMRYDVSKRAWLQFAANNIFNTFGVGFPGLTGGIPIPLANGQFGYTYYNNIGPATYHLTFHQELGR